MSYITSTVYQKFTPQLPDKKDVREVSGYDPMKRGIYGRNGERRKVIGLRVRLLTKRTRVNLLNHDLKSHSLPFLFFLSLSFSYAPGQQQETQKKYCIFIFRSILRTHPSFIIYKFLLPLLHRKNSPRKIVLTLSYYFTSTYEQVVSPGKMELLNP